MITWQKTDPEPDNFTDADPGIDPGASWFVQALCCVIVLAFWLARLVGVK